MYALAAGAAGVGVLALAAPAEAKIIYTPADQVILGPRGTYEVDLNHDGVVDFGFANTTRFDTDQFFSNLFVQSPKGNAVVGTFVYRGFPANAHVFKAGSQIGGFEKFFPGDVKMVSYYSGGGGQSAHGNWVNVTNGYLGLQFQIDRKTHYGWARFSVKVLKTSLRIQAVLTGYAYEDVPNTPIIAGRTSGTDAEEMPQSLNAPAAEPTMLGMLAMGSSGLSMWRRESEEGTK